MYPAPEISGDWQSLSTSDPNILGVDVWAMGVTFLLVDKRETSRTPLIIGSNGVASKVDTNMGKGM